MDYRAFTIPEHRPFRILQLTDIHLGGSILSKKYDRLALSAVAKLAERAQPDLIVSTGDNVYPIPFYRGSLNNLKTLKRLACLLESFGVPWTTVFGNHDVESFALHSKERLSDYLESLPHCVYRRGERHLTGAGNTMLLLKDGQGRAVMALTLLDSNMYAGKTFYSGFDHIHADQLDWYEGEIRRLSRGEALLPSLLFFHIPVTEFRDAWRLFCSGSRDVVYHFGEVGETNDYFGVPRSRENVFPRLKALGSARGIFVGHDHLNTVSLTYEGIRLTYGMSIDYLAYRNIRSYSSQRGGTLITVNADTSFDVRHIPLDSPE